MIDFKRETFVLPVDDDEDEAVDDINQMFQSILKETANQISKVSFDGVAKEELKPILTVIKEALENKLLNVYDVVSKGYYDDKKYDLSSTEEGREILSILEKRETKRMNFLIKNNRKGKYNRAKMMVVGAGGAGKTSLCNSLLEKPFNPNHDSTVVANAELNASIDSKDVDISNWREIGKGEYLLSNDFKAMTKNIIQDKKEGNLKVDEANEKIYENKESLTKLIRKEKLQNTKKVTQKEKQEKPRMFGWFKKEKNANVENFDTSLLKKDESGRKLSIWDFGGQKVFDVLHHLYLTNAGLVLLVVNLLLFLTDPELAVQELETWFKSLCVYTKSVRVFIVGTRAKSRKLKKKSLEKINSTIENVIFDHDAVQVVKNRSGEKVLSFFPVENSLGRGNEKYLRPLKTAIAEALEPVQGPNELKLPANEMIPLAWMVFIQIMHRDMGNVVALNELYEKGQDMGFELEEMKHLVDFFTRSGIIVSFHKRFQDIERSEDEIVDDVVLKPNWLLSALGSFICDESLHQTEFTKVAEQKNMGKLVKIYRDNGILENSLLEAVLKLKNVKPREIAFIKNVCQKMLVMSKLSVVPESLDLAPRHLKASGGCFWMVPAMNKVSKLDESIGFESDTTEGSIKWVDIIPQGLFERCVCALLAQDSVQMELEGISITAARLKYKGKLLELKQLSSKKYGVRLDSSRPMFVREVRAMLMNVKKEVNELGFALHINAQIKFADDLNLMVQHQDTALSPQITNESTTTEFKWHCFLSHTWGKGQATHKRVVEIANLMKAEGVNVWLDEEQMQGNIVNAMVNGIMKSAVFLVFITRDYLEASNKPNSNAGKEMYFATKLGSENMIPVLLDPTLENPNDWTCSAGFILGPALYTNLATDENLKSNLPGLCQKILQMAQQRAALSK